MDLILPAAEAYAEKYSEATDPLLQRIEAESRVHEHMHMLSGALQGKLLEMISLIAQPKYILEIGTFLGYSALCLAKGLKPGGELHTVELREETAAVAQGYFNMSPQASQIILHTGNALDVLSRLDYSWDLVFIDADKPGYEAYYRRLMPGLKSGALILADNMLFHGQVLENPVRGKNAEAMLRFSEMVQEDDRVGQVMLTVRDGLLLIRKK